MSVDAFPRTWAAEVLPRPPLIAPVRQFVYPQQIPGEEDALARGALVVNVRPASGGSFLATFALGFREVSLPSGVWACPAPETMLAVAGGYGYLVNTSAPEKSELLEQRPITAILPAPMERRAPIDGLLLLAGFHNVLAVGAEGVRWRTERLSWEGVTLQEVRNGQLLGVGWDMFADADVEFAVDIQTGRHEGGGYRR